MAWHDYNEAEEDWSRHQEALYFQELEREYGAYLARLEQEHIDGLIDWHEQNLGINRSTGKHP